MLRHDLPVGRALPRARLVPIPSARLLPMLGDLHPVGLMVNGRLRDTVGRSVLRAGPARGWPGGIAARWQTLQVIPSRPPGRDVKVASASSNPKGVVESAEEHTYHTEVLKGTLRIVLLHEFVTLGISNALHYAHEDEAEPLLFIAPTLSMFNCKIDQR